MAQLVLLGVALTVAVTSGSIVQSPLNGKDFELLILHNNDMHARFEQTSQLSGACTTADREAGKCYGGFPRVAHVVKEARKAAATGQGPPVLYLNAGDTYTGTAWFTIYKWKIAAEFVNALQPDAVALGNHELDENVEGVIPFIQNITTPVLAANLILDKVPEMKNLTNLLDSIVLTKGGVKIGIIGYITPTTKSLAPSNAIEYEDEIVALKREVSKLKRQGVNILIGLGHSGYVRDQEIARDVEGLDLVIGGHSHTFLLSGNFTNEKPEEPQGPYPTIITQPSGRKVLVVQAYKNTKYIGKLNLVFDSQGEIIKHDGEPILLNHDIPRDPELLKTVNKYREEFYRIANETVGNSMVALDGETCRLWECNLGDFIADSMLHYTRERYNTDDVNIAFIQGGRIRASIDRPQKPFALTRNDWITVLPFSDPINIVTVNGSVLMRALEHSVAGWRLIDSSGQFLQYSGVQVTYDLEKPPGSRILKAKAVCSTCESNVLTTIKDDYTYKIMMSEFLANQGDDFTMFQDQHVERKSYSELDCVLHALKRYGTVDTEIDARITIINEDKVNDSTASSGTKICVSRVMFLIGVLILHSN